MTTSAVSLTDGNRRFAVLAIDHRDSLRVVLAPEDPASVPAERIVKLKRAIIAEVADLATGVMLEPEYSIPDLVGDLPAGVGFSAALESQGYSADPGTTITEILDGWSVAAAKAAGAGAAKLLAYLSSDPAHIDAQRAVIAQVVDECRAVDLPLILEPLAVPGSNGAAKLAAVAQTLDLGADITKTAWPGSDHLDELANLLEAHTWVLLSGGGGFEEYLGQVRACVQRGCSGFMAGRAVWREAADPVTPDPVAALRSVARDRFARLREALG